MGNINLNLGCSLEAMRSMGDNQYDLAIVDPPYGLGNRTFGTNESKKTRNTQTRFESHNWDDSIPPIEYFEELRRVSKNQIIWGGNYFNLPPTRCVLVWDKMNYLTTMSRIEIAWTSYDKPAKLTKINSNQTNRFHPTQKPAALYRWLLDNYAQEGDRILDTHLGSGSIAIACYDAGFALDAWEIDPDYHARALARFEKHSRQLRLFGGDDG